MNRHKCRNMTNYCISNIELTSVQMCVMFVIHKTQNNRNKNKKKESYNMKNLGRIGFLQIPNYFESIPSCNEPNMF